MKIRTPNTHKMADSPLTDTWWCWREDGNPIDGDVMLMCNAGDGDDPEWPPWATESPGRYIAERFVRPSARSWPGRYVRYVDYLETEE